MYYCLKHLISCFVGKLLAICFIVILVKNFEQNATVRVKDNTDIRGKTFIGGGHSQK